ncbi:Predicted nucleotide-binding protein containing TIR-like domain-containing protein [Clostridium cavendishii DSM 21758]|uniref:Predicted nucleotide-binding protein containing TIR-like domain-containing protein n=1 Tax=Clostridium cavendishii DSM 21758 TaxID=1121302 RepID=A0A1M6GFM7_9CLOT|nr:nucleotide-binding protein [Clostridium cavendishii]SHJ08693.1 Predicted nucleotide-binding protein containing TIR-like domain-containing protein [Clostridium cavendishii DSM 21758]
MTINNKPRVFIGSAVESINIAKTIQKSLQYSCYCETWAQGIFKPSNTALESLIEALDIFDFAIFVFSPDDISKIRDKAYTIVRDNVLFETGLFIGRIGRRRVFYLAPDRVELHLPTDLFGFNPERYDSTHPNVEAALEIACSSIEEQILILGKIDRK